MTPRTAALRSARIALGMTQAGFARALGVHRESVRNAERGDFTLDKDRLHQAAAMIREHKSALDVALTEVLDAINE